MSAEPVEPVDPVDRLTRILVRACRNLAEAGEARRAGELAGEAWATLRRGHARQAQHLDGVMHHIARLEQNQEQGQLRTHQEGTTMTNDRVLDVREEIPRRRHELIFESFVDLPVGDAYVLVNDHDPKPLRYQFEAENAGEFTWEYLEEGPEVWRVRIGRLAAPSGAV